MKRIFVLVASVLIFSMPLFGEAQIFIVNVDGANEGFNDPTPAAPVGGNPGTTVGQQRLIAFQFAADLWGAVLDSDVPIYVQAAFNPQTCTATSAVLGSAGAIQIFANFPGTELNLTWYHVALANKLAGVDLAPGPNGTIADDIVAVFNSNLNGNPACLGGRGWYYGLDENHGSNIDLVTVLLHELGHGLGFANFVNELTGTRPLDLPDVFSEYTVDQTTGETWNQMTNAERQASAANSSRVYWSGLNVSKDVPAVLSFGLPLLRVNSPAGIANVYAVGTAAFGPALTSPGITGDVVQALDAADVAGPTTFDACSTITNPTAVAGKIALVDRGTCGFAIKVKNAQDAGAVAVIVADNAAGSPPAGMAGVDPTIIIPSARITLPDGNLIKANLAAPVNATLGVDVTVRAGTNRDGFALLNAPVPVTTGSSISHWDPVAFRNQLMEPSINSDLTHSLEVPEDLTLSEMTDIGWFSDGDGVPDGRDQCIGSDPSTTVVIDSCDSGAPNVLFTDGCKISDAIEQCASNAGNHGAFASCVTQYTNQLRKAGIITGAQKDAIQTCTGGANIP